MQIDYNAAMKEVFADEGGYTNDPHDPGGPTNWGITLADAKLYWKSNATADDVKNMSKSVAEDIYAKHYANPIHFNDLPAGIDYAVLDYGINSGLGRAVRVLQSIVDVRQDGVVGPTTIDAARKANAIEVINNIYDERLAFLKSLHTWTYFQHGWTDRCTRGRKLALSMVQPNEGTNMTTSTSTIGTTVVTDIADVSKALSAVETFFADVLPVVGAFYAPANAVTPFLPAITAALNAVNTVVTNSGSDLATAIQDVVNTLTPGQPNAPALQ